MSLSQKLYSIFWCSWLSILGGCCMLYGIVIAVGTALHASEALFGNEYTAASFFVLGAVLYLSSAFRFTQDQRIIRRGQAATGTVTSIGRSRSGMRSFGTQGIVTSVQGFRSYRLEFTYEAEGKQYSGKSLLLWYPPKVPKTGQITVYYMPGKPSRCAVDFPII